MCVFQCDCKCHWNVARDTGENYVFIPWRRNSTALFCCPSLDLLRRTIFKWIIVQRNLYMYSGTCILIDSLQNIFLYTCQYILFYMNIMTPQIHIEKVHKCSYAYACYLTCSFNTAALFPWAIYALYYVLCFHLRNITVVYLFTFLFFENQFINKIKVWLTGCVEYTVCTRKNSEYTLSTVC